MPKLLSFHSNSRIMIVADTAVIFYDFVAQSGDIITSAELDGKTPSYAEFVGEHLCAIGCSDGVIRIWSCDGGKVIKKLEAHARGEITFLKSILDKRYLWRDASVCPFVLCIFSQHK